MGNGRAICKQRFAIAGLSKKPMAASDHPVDPANTSRRAIASGHGKSDSEALLADRVLSKPKPAKLKRRHGLERAGQPENR